MIRVIQTRLHDPPQTKGNCFAACIASFLECDIDDVPPVEVIMSEKPEENKWWTKLMIHWLSRKGWVWGLLDDHAEGYYMVIGQSKRGVNHVCIYKDGELWHDPHPSNDGLITEDHFEYLERAWF